MLDLTPETRATGTWDEPLRPFRGRRPGENDLQYQARMFAALRSEPTYSCGLDQG